ncbi:hypothetical protein CERSUDRAFT_26385, partial [Gelatoporia subvermispora B]
NIGWAECAKQLQNHDEAMVKAWKEEIDALLVFAGLFSAVLTAFNVEVCTSLSPNSNQNVNAQILMRLLTQLSIPAHLGIDDVAILPGFTAETASPNASFVWINALWFASLVLSLSTASVGIIARQW